MDVHPNRIFKNTLCNPDPLCYNPYYNMQINTEDEPC